MLFGQQRTYTAARLQSEAPRIDGIIDEAAWNVATWEGDFIQRQPYEKQKPSQPTEFKIIYDDNNLYVAIKVYDSAPDSIYKAYDTPRWV
jgi:hypothetical protein